MDLGKLMMDGTPEEVFSRGGELKKWDWHCRHLMEISCSAA